MTDGFPSIELLEESHDFPCVYVIKAIGKTDNAFVGRVLTVVRDELGGTQIEPPFSTRQTSAGRHTCVTIQPFVDSAQQVLAIYQRLQELDGLVMLM